jgi:GGDEF domain-containing protein
VDKLLEGLPFIKDVKAGVETLARMAFQSSLTGLPNRSAYDAFQELVPEGPALAVAFMDLTGFKSINETHGYAGGNATLVHTGGALERHRRNSGWERLSFQRG